MSFRKIILLVVALSFIVLSATSGAFAAAAKKNTASAAQSSSSPTLKFDSIGFVNMQDVLQSHPQLRQTQQKIMDTARQKEREATAAAEKEPDQAKKAQLVQAKRMEMAQEEQKLMAPILRDCEQAVRDIAAKKKLALVLDQFVVLVGGVDITQDVIQQLSRSK
ncbi:MAG: OmpH family outer membrane protein [Synergistaceae bacterium]|nr:OmpH family outer membrane protein [Synergistaceae bacterium]